MAETTESRREVQRSPSSEPSARRAAPSPFEQFGRLFDDVFGRGLLAPLETERPGWDLLGWSDMRPPRVDVIDRENELLVKAELPGVKREDLDVSVSDTTLTIKAESATTSEQEEGDFHRREIARGMFRRSVALPAEVDADNARAEFRDGILELTLPKVQEARRRRIEVR